MLFLLIGLFVPLTLTAQTGSKSDKRIAVFAAKASVKSIQDNVQIIGSLRARESIELRSDITERVTKIHVESGESVKAGQLLISLDTAEERALRREELARIDEAQRQADRIKPLVKKRISTQAILDQQNVLIDSAKARLAAIDAQIAQRRLVAPFNGTVGLRYISEGALASPGDVMLTLDTLDSLQADFSVPEKFLASLSRGAVIEASTSAYPGTIFSAKVEFIDTRVDPSTRYIRVRAFFSDKDSRLLPGMLMQATLKTNDRRSLFVPEEAISARGSKLRVMRLIANDTSYQVEVKDVLIGGRRDGWVEVLEGLTENDIVVTHGGFKLSPGSQVKINAMQTGNESLAELLRASAKPSASTDANK